jgi:hypothetical protein
MLKASVDYQLRQLQFPGQYRMSRLNYPLDACQVNLGAPGMVCETVFPPTEPDRIDRESAMKGIVNLSGQVLRDSVAGGTPEFLKTPPRELFPRMKRPPPVGQVRFCGSLRGETTSLDIERMSDGMGHGLHETLCAQREGGDPTRTSIDTRAGVKDATTVLFLKRTGGRPFLA